jgi:hypothetical protein
LLNLRVLFPEMKQTHDMGFIKLEDGSVRAMYNRDDKKHYSIRGGKFTFDGRPTSAQHRCEEPAG